MLVIREKENLKTEVTRKQSMPNLPKSVYFLPLISTGTCAYQGVRNVPFSENLGCFVFLKHPFRDLLFCFIANKLVGNIYDNFAKICFPPRHYHTRHKHYISGNRKIVKVSPRKILPYVKINSRDI